MYPHSVRLYNWQLEVPNLKEYHVLKREIFSQHQYFIELASPKPIIIDAGAHIGLSTLYFKRLFPGSLIISLEPHLHSFRFLQQNLESNQIQPVLPLNQALWPYKQDLKLFADPSPDHWWSNTGVIEKPGTQPFAVSTVTLKELYEGVGEKIDLLKLDVEGAEWDLLFTSFTHFNYIHHYLIEYHPQPSRTLLDFCANFPHSHSVSCFKNGKPLNPKTRNPGLVIVKANRV